MHSHKKCKGCHITKPKSEFYALKSAADGLWGKCKECVRKRVAERYNFLMKNDPEFIEKELARQRIKQRKRVSLGLHTKMSPEETLEKTRKWRRENSLKNIAHNAINNAVRDKKIQKLPCAVCGNKKAEGHHDDYSKPLDVIWLCKTHHAERHVLLRQQQRALKRLNP